MNTLPTMKEIISMTDEMRIIRVHGREHVIAPFTRDDDNFGEPNYLDTDCALIAVLEKGQSLESFKTKWIKLKKELINTKN